MLFTNTSLEKVTTPLWSDLYSKIDIGGFKMTKKKWKDVISVGPK